MNDVDIIVNFLASILLVVVIIFIYVIISLIFRIIGTYKIHKILGLSSPWLSVIWILDKVQPCSYLKDDDDRIEILGLPINYLIVALSDILLPCLSMIPIIGAVLSISASVIINTIYYAKVLAVLNGRKPDEYKYYIVKGIFWFLFPILIGIDLIKNYDRYMQLQNDVINNTDYYDNY